MGGGAVTFPAGTGVKIGSGGGQYVVLEVHLDNPTGASDNLITSGVRLHTAPLRQHDIGTLILVSSFEKRWHGFDGVAYSN